jgi:hypothetical protein
MEPNSFDVTLVNDDLSMDPSNPLSPLYGKIGPNTQARMLMFDEAAISVSDAFGRSAASGWGSTDTGQAWTNSGGSASDYSVSGGLGRMSLGSINTSRRVTLAGTKASGEIRVKVTIPVDPTGDDIETTIMFNYQDASNYYQCSIYWDRDGRPIELRFVERIAGVASDLGITHLTMSPVAAGLSCNMVLRWFNNHMSMKVWPAADPEPVLWNLSVRDSSFASGLIGLRANLQPLFASGVPQVVTWDNFSYSAYAARVISAGEIGSWRPETTVDHVPAISGKSWTNITADDPLRRIGKADDPGISPLRRQITSYGATLLGYWPLEEGPDAANFTNLSAPANVGYYTSGLVDLGADEGPAGSFSSPTIDLNGAMGGFFTFDSSSDGYQLCFCMKLDAVPAAAPYIAMFQWSDTMQRTWYWRVNNGSFEIAVYDLFSTLLDSQTVLFGTGVDVTQWVRYRIKVSVSGSTVTYEPAWYQQDAITSFGTTGSFVNVTVGYPVAWRIVANSYTDKASFSHIFGVSDLALDLVNSADARNPFNAYNGEVGWIRFVRLLVENGYGYIVKGDTSQGAVMGRQPRSTLVELLKEIAVTEGGLIFGDPTRVRLVLRLNNDLVNQTPIMALTKGVDLGYPLKKVIDDQRAANDITVKNWDDTTYRATKESGARSVLDPPLGAGRYPGGLDVSFKWTDHLAQRGGWELANNTLDRPRYPMVSADLLANPSLLPAADAAEPGDIITLAGVEPEIIYLMVIQFSRSGNDVRDTLDMACIPADVFMAGTYDTTGRKYDSASTTITADISSSATSVPIFTARALEKWRTSGTYPIRVGPEVMTVTSCTTGTASGTGWTQVMTVTRGTNGVAIAHLSGAEVHVATPAKYTLKNRNPI